MSVPDHPFDAVILAGGAARRMGGADKPGMDVGGATLLERVAASVPDARRIVVVGPRRPRPRARYVREDPPGGGPVPALRAGLAEVEAASCALLGADLPFLRPEHIGRLRRAASGRSGAVFVDAAGQRQWLVGFWDTAVLRTALAAYTGRSLRGLLGPLNPAPVAVPEPGDPALSDCDTPEDLARARALIHPSNSENGTASRRNPRMSRNFDR
ncbi:molybdopterin-guanine dinucleotide biosynthesis protein A [Nocardiopsis mwathae]|uniref:Molybdopterin-guanine dinucleotide biosynthesis protein A n=1 Tax=Nocardiopsis mwathae TaxID=1472723 RepID=A0A7W9YH99_9ACTN|nr:molybdenum cofactor guanylyltransferase [Nocardiopsis mwathae]MBB6172117.1 molybdopterin-guanine dinucleotide biosynthesis protein A [Nocardiopsis mwathae]